MIMVASALAFLVPSVAAQTDVGGTVSCSGKAVLHPKPTVLRLRFSIMECGENLEAALKNLDRRGDAYRKALLAAHANADSIKIGDPMISSPLDIPEPIPQVSSTPAPATGKPPPPNYVTSPVAPVEAPPSTSPAPTIVPPPSNAPIAMPYREFRPQTKVQAWLNAEWALKEETPTTLLFEMHNIAKSVHKEMKEAVSKMGPTDFGPVHFPDFQRTYGVVDESPTLDVPRYIFVTPISAEQLQKLRVKAIANARAEAVKLAEAAGCRVGSVQSLSAIWGRSSWTPPGYCSPCAEVDSSGPTELIGSGPSNPQHCELILNATFRLQQPGEPAGAAH
jgi:hypothetical protein